MKRYKLNKVFNDHTGMTDVKFEEADDGPWVRWEDVPYMDCQEMGAILKACTDGLQQCSACPALACCDNTWTTRSKSV